MILLRYAYSKNAAADLTPKQVSQLARIVRTSSALKKELFEELLVSVREAGAILRGRQKPFAAVGGQPSRGPGHSRTNQPFAVGVRAFDRCKREQDRRPTGPAAALLSIIEHNPALAVKAIHRI
jgi:hypothetical protein